jgi:hypothetical protein
LRDGVVADVLVGQAIKDSDPFDFIRAIEIVGVDDTDELLLEVEVEEIERWSSRRPLWTLTPETRSGLPRSEYELTCE